MNSKNVVADNTEYYYEGSLPVLAGRFRRKLVGYFNGNIPPGTRVGREIRLIKLPQLTWVYGFLIRDSQHGVAVYVPNGALLPGVEGFHPVRSGRQIRHSQPITSKQPPARPKPLEAVESDLDNLDDFNDLANIEDINLIPRP